MITIKKGKGKLYSEMNKGGRYTKDGLIYKNNLLNVDYTSQTGSEKKLNRVK